MNDKQITMISVMPDVHGGIGHHVGYHQSVGNAARACGWRHVALVSTSHGLARLPESWRAVLDTGLLTTGLPQVLARGKAFALLGDMRRFTDTLVQAVQEELRLGAAGECIVFLDDFNGPQLLAIRQAMRRLPKERLHFWFLYRYDPAARGIAGKLYQRAVASLIRLFPNGRFRMLTDSVPLATELKSTFGMPAHVMPIPHTSAQASRTLARDPDEIICWWPGAPRPDKGLDVMQRLAQAPAPVPAGRRIRLALSEAANIASGVGVTVQALPRHLSSGDYDAWLHTADVLLMPYDRQRYRLATSGIFAECVAAGKIPLVTDGTWMAFELDRHDLRELVCDWSDPAGTLATIRRAAEDPELRQKLSRMRESFLEFHSEGAYARELRGLASNP
ncbi:glycosyltransferase family 4 protein [Ramlibacter sp. G-1-2-2]|uniref:Glycosyltransferase family 4 protein n=1 Tax=Ramlibacter agri TaxID=2728837 RepID=A0A848H0S9_9BURK|nr:hypothetical protein [Ramlibacter agri]NML42710.1 glycosyltransferase family 4 protein [Ramlibacter agri]